MFQTKDESFDSFVLVLNFQIWMFRNILEKFVDCSHCTFIISEFDLISLWIWYSVDPMQTN